jgi:hypothetical protein
MQKLFLARELDISHWLLPAHVALCLRGESLSLGEMRLLPLEDLHLIVTVRERLHTAKVAATVEDVSRHVQPLISAAVEVFTLNSAANIMSTPPDDYLFASTLAPSPVPPTAAPVAAAPETVVEAKHSPAETGFDPVAMRKALEVAAYDRAVADISPADSEEASRVLVEWTT